MKIRVVEKLVFNNSNDTFSKADKAYRQLATRAELTLPGVSQLWKPLRDYRPFAKFLKMAAGLEVG